MKVLVIAPFYAPSSEVPSARMLSLTRYLIQQGHQVTVVCWSKEKLLTIYKEKELNSTIPDGVNIVDINFEDKKIPIFTDLIFGKKMKKFLCSSIDLKEYEIAFVTCGPYFTLEAMPYIKSKFGLKYVLDFRDLGALNYRPKLGNELDKKNKRILNFLKKLILQWYQNKVFFREKRAVINADGLICVSAIDKEKMQKAYAISDEKCIIATNGYDDIKLNKIVVKDKEPGIVGAVFGKFMYYSRSRAEALLLGIDKKRKSGINIKLQHIGRNFDYIDEAIQKYNIDPGAFEKMGLKEYSEGMSILGAADFFVVEDTSPDDVGTKIYDYIYWNKPIIAAVPPNIPLAKLISQFEHGYLCETSDDIERAIDDIIRNQYSVLDPSIDIAKYSRTYQNEKMEQLMIQIISRR
mgnify:FL=1